MLAALASSVAQPSGGASTAMAASTDPFSKILSGSDDLSGAIHPGPRRLY
jgi:hypothetical protein